MAPMSLVKAPTPLSRIARLLGEAFPLLDGTHPAHALIKEALLTAGGLDPYIESTSSPLIVPSTHAVPEAEVQKVFADLLRTTEETDWKKLYQENTTTWELSSGMCSGAYEATVIQQIALASHSTQVLEIGLFTGTTTLALALLPEVKEIVALDIEPFLETYDRPYWERSGVSHKIKTRFLPAIESLHKLKAEGHAPFDLVFIDADKPSYLSYCQTLLDLDLLALGGIILADNTLYKGYPFANSAKPVTPSAQTNSNNRSHDEATQGIHDFNTSIRSDARLYVTVLPVRDGVSIIRRKI